MSVVRFRPDTREFVVEEPQVATSEPELSAEVLRARLQQQQLLADFGVLALKATPFAELLQEATRFAAAGLGAEFAKVLQFLPDENRFVVRAGVGWGDGVIGVATIGADTASPAGYALKTGKAVISNHLDIEERFRTPELLVQFGIHRAINVILGGEGAPFGVLEVDSRSEGDFSESDIVFLRGVANILGMAIERQRMEGDLRKALDRHQVLIEEVNHRVNNSFQIVAGMLRLQASVAGGEDVRHELQQASTRIMAVARAHRRLYRGDDVEALDLGEYLRDACSDISASMPACELDVSAGSGIIIRIDRAIPAVLLVNELITNAMKYAYPDRDCKVWVTLSAISGDAAVITVRDEGVGLPAQFDPKSKGLGMRLISAFAKQLNGDLQVNRKEPGTQFVFKFPLRD
jgi:two-component sensor histidine kinase